MALLINQAAPAGTDSPTLGDDQIRAFKLAIQDIFGVPDNTTITNAVSAINATGLQYIKFNDLSGSPASSGRLAQNSTNLEFHDGTAAAVLMSTRNGAATQAEMEAASSLTTYVSPGRTQYHPGVAKVWGVWSNDGTVSGSRNITSITDTGAGDHTVNFTTAFSSANWSGHAAGESTTNVVAITASGTGTGRIQSAGDLGNWRFSAFGDQ